MIIRRETKMKTRENKESSKGLLQFRWQHQGLPSKFQQQQHLNSCINLLVYSGSDIINAEEIKMRPIKTTGCYTSYCSRVQRQHRRAFFYDTSQVKHHMETPHGMVRQRNTKILRRKEGASGGRGYSLREDGSREGR